MFALTDVPLRFSRVGGAALPPPHRRCASARPAVFSGDTYSTGLFRLAGVGIPVGGVSAGVSGHRLDELFSGCGTATTRVSTRGATVGGEQSAGVPGAVVVGGGINEPSVSFPGERSRSDGVGTEVGLFEELTPIGFKASAALAESGEPCPNQDAVGKQDLGTPPEGRRAESRSRRAAVARGSLDQSLPDANDVLSAESGNQLIRGPSPACLDVTDGRVSRKCCASADNSNCAGATVVSDLRVHAAGGEDQGLNVATATAGGRRSGPGGGTSDRTNSSSVRQTSTPPQVSEIALAPGHNFAVNTTVGGVTVALRFGSCACLSNRTIIASLRAVWFSSALTLHSVSPTLTTSRFILEASTSGR